AFAGHTLYVTEHGELVEAREVADPFAEVECLRTQFSVPRIDGLPGFTGGLVGWFGFGCIQYIESRLAGGDKPDEAGTPAIQLVHRLRNSGASYPETLDPNGLDEADFVSGFTREAFIEAVEQSKEYIRAGDIFQVVLSQRLSVPFRARPVDVYRALRALNPSP